jgi:hypothetical protein
MIQLDSRVGAFVPLVIRHPAVDACSERTITQRDSRIVDNVL